MALTVSGSRVAGTNDLLKPKIPASVAAAAAPVVPAVPSVPAPIAPVAAMPSVSALPPSAAVPTPAAAAPPPAASAPAPTYADPPLSRPGYTTNPDGSVTYNPRAAQAAMAAAQAPQGTDPMGDPMRQASPPKVSTANVTPPTPAGIAATMSATQGQVPTVGDAEPTAAIAPSAPKPTVPVQAPQQPSTLTPQVAMAAAQAAQVPALATAPRPTDPMGDPMRQSTAPASAPKASLPAQSNPAAIAGVMGNTQQQPTAPPSKPPASPLAQEALAAFDQGGFDAFFAVADKASGAQAAQGTNPMGDPMRQAPTPAAKASLPAQSPPTDIAKAMGSTMQQSAAPAAKAATPPPIYNPNAGNQMAAAQTPGATSAQAAMAAAQAPATPKTPTGATGAQAAMFRAQAPTQAAAPKTTTQRGLTNSQVERMMATTQGRTPSAPRNPPSAVAPTTRSSSSPFMARTNRFQAPTATRPSLGLDALLTPQGGPVAPVLDGGFAGKSPSGPQNGMRQQNVRALIDQYRARIGQG